MLLIIEFINEGTHKHYNYLNDNKTGMYTKVIENVQDFGAETKWSNQSGGKCKHF